MLMLSSSLSLHSSLTVHSSSSGGKQMKDEGVSDAGDVKSLLTRACVTPFWSYGTNHTAHTTTDFFRKESFFLEGMHFSGSKLNQRTLLILPSGTGRVTKHLSLNYSTAHHRFTCISHQGQVLREIAPKLAGPAQELICGKSSPVSMQQLL